jgi:hypothetical protein
MTEPLLQHDAIHAEMGDGGDAAELGFGLAGATLGAKFEKRYNTLTAAVADEEDLLAAKHASLHGVHTADDDATTVCCKAAQQQQQQLMGDSDEADDDVLVVLCGEDSIISTISSMGAGSSSSGSSSSSPSAKGEILSGFPEEE